MRAICRLNDLGSAQFRNDRFPPIAAIRRAPVLHLRSRLDRGAEGFGLVRSVGAEPPGPSPDTGQPNPDGCFGSRPRRLRQPGPSRLAHGSGNTLLTTHRTSHPPVVSCSFMAGGGAGSPLPTDCDVKMRWAENGFNDLHSDDIRTAAPPKADVSDDRAWFERKMRGAGGRPSAHHPFATHAEDEMNGSTPYRSPAQLVAEACSANPVAVIIPCHRVVRSDGSMGGYRWGTRRKKALLAREQACAS